jgi:hypothetical protein
MGIQVLVGRILDHPRLALVAALILAALSLSGRFSVTATRLLLFAAWIVAIFSFYGFEPIRCRLWLLIVTIGSSGGCLCLLAAWAQPEAVPLNTGILRPRYTLLWSSKAPNRLMEIGKSTAMLKWDGPNGGEMFNFFNESKLTIEQAGRKVKVSTEVRDRNGNLVAELIRNEWKVLPAAWDRNYTDDALEVRDSTGTVVLQVKALPDRIQLQGEWRTTGGYGARISECINPQNGQVGGCITKLSPTYNPTDTQIKPMFEYPSDLHFGELKR